MRTIALLAALGVVTAGCGSRLTAAQVAALGGAAAGPSLTTPAQQAAGRAAPGSAVVPAAGGSPSNPSAPGAPSAAGNTLGPTNAATNGHATAPAAAATAAPGQVAPAVCNGPVSGPGVTATEIDLGNVSTLTGPIPGLFLGAQHGTSAFAAYLNSIGGICGRRVVVKSADDNLDVSQNATATQSLAGSVFAFVGSFSGFDQGSASVLQSDGVPDVGEATNPARYNLANNFSPQPNPLGLNLAPYLTLKQKYPAAVTHMALLVENASTGAEISTAQEQALQSIGYKFVFTDSNIEPTQTDFSADAQAMKSAGAQGLVFLADAALYADVARALQNAGLHMPLATYSTNAYDPVFIPDAGTAANGAVIAEYSAMYQGEDAAAVPMVALLDKWYKALYNTAPDEFAAWAWMSGLLFIDGLNQGGGLTRANLLNGLRQVTKFDAGGLVAEDDPAHKKPPACYLIIDVVNEHFVRDPADPPSGFACTNSPNFYYAKG